jgi:hypothetical protein
MNPKKQLTEPDGSGPLISAEEFARRTGLNIKTVYSSCQRDELPHVRAGRRLLLYSPATAAPAADPPLSPLRCERRELFAELLARQPQGRLSLDGVGYATAAAAGMGATAVDQAIEDLGERVKVARDGTTITVALVHGQGGMR